MTTITTSKEYEQLTKQTKDATLLGTTIALLHWDQEVMMPKKGIDFRADQIALTSRMYHEMC
ncbi:MAG: carboxypeptidase M32, partial [Planctomycetes bacterium]|nr:carboxypeptidase M32 [Planctomycetota bacterium]